MEKAELTMKKYMMIVFNNMSIHPEKKRHISGMLNLFELLKPMSMFELNNKNSKCIFSNKKHCIKD